MIEFIRTVMWSVLIVFLVCAVVGACQGFYLGVRDIRAYRREVLDNRDEIK